MFNLHETSGRYRAQLLLDSFIVFGRAVRPAASDRTWRSLLARPPLRRSSSLYVLGVFLNVRDAQIVELVKFDVIVAINRPELGCVFGVKLHHRS